jgi:hypothetical protein
MDNSKFRPSLRHKFRGLEYIDLFLYLGYTYNLEENTNKKVQITKKDTKGSKISKLMAGL